MTFYEVWGVTPWDSSSETGDEADQLDVVDADSDDGAVAAWRAEHPHWNDSYEAVYAVRLTGER